VAPVRGADGASPTGLALVACDVLYVLDEQLVTRARGRAGRRRPAPPDRPGRRRREAPPPLRT
jgi:hypothetical protein